MASSNHKCLLQACQDLGCPECLPEFVQVSGREVQKYPEVVDLPVPVFEGLLFRIQPSYEGMEGRDLYERMAKVEELVRGMADSRRADMTTIALDPMGFPGWEALRSNLEGSFASELKWERLTAVGALGRVSGKVFSA